jgi:predicted metal-dependent HD superfamily phosphohydrolase
MTDLAERWPLAERADIRDALLAAYDDSSRGYHDSLHLTEVLGRLDELATQGATFDRRAVELAAWFHDAVYDPRRDDNEEQSALLAERMLSGTDPDRIDIAEVARLVRLTATHDPDAGDAAGELLCDADLAVLAGDMASYEAYTEGVRAEYAHVSDDDFRRGRAAVLEQLLAMPTLFRTSVGRARWETRARDNLTVELARLS